MTDQVQEYTVGAFRGNYPDVPIEQSVTDGIKELDANPFYAVLPIVPEVGATSNNGLLYDEELVNSIAKQINENKPGGIFGHLKDEDRNTSYPLPSGMWVGAMREGNTLWGKVYCPPGAGREHIRTLKAVGGQIATSIYGKGDFKKVSDGVRRLTNFKLESLDFAPPSRAALGYGAVPHVTAEMDSEQEPIMADKAQVIAELTVGDVAAIPIAVREAIVAEANKQDENMATIAELTATKTAHEEVIRELNATVESFRRERVESAVDARVAELTDWQVKDDDGKEKLKKLRALLRGQIITRMGGDLKAERVAEVADAAWADLQPLAEMIRDALAGPPAVVSGRVSETNGRKALEDTPANREAAMSQMGIQI